MGTLTTLWRAGRNGGFEPLLQPHLDRLYRLAYRFTGDRHDAEDLVQDFLVQIYPRRRELARVANLEGWLTRSLYHRFIDTVRREQRNPLAAVDDGSVDQFPCERSGPEGDAEQMWAQRRLRLALGALDAEQRAVIALHDMEGFTLNELQEVLGAPLGTLKSRLHRARRALRERFLQLETPPREIDPKAMGEKPL